MNVLLWLLCLAFQCAVFTAFGEWIAMRIFAWRPARDGAVSYNEGKHIAVGAPVRLAENAVYAVNIAYRVPLASPEVVPRKIEQALQELVQHALGSRGAGA